MVFDSARLSDVCMMTCYGICRHVMTSTNILFIFVQFVCVQCDYSLGNSFIAKF